MNNLPQSVTDRYVSNLLRDGVNAEFRLAGIDCKPWVAEERICGYYYRACVYNKAEEAIADVGTTPHVALANALSKAGVTFR